MTRWRTTILTRLAERRLLARWAEAADQADRLPVAELRNLQAKLRPLSEELARIDRVASARLTGTANAIRKPRGTDWAYRPRLWRENIDRRGQSFVSSPGWLDGETTLFHDCDLHEIGFRQTPTRSSEALSPFDVQLEVMHFRGSFLSLSIDFPNEALSDLHPQHLVEATAELKTDRPTEIFFRLNLRQDQEVKQILHSVPESSGEMPVQFDLAYSDVQPRQIDKIWLDVIFPSPAMNLLTLSDLTLTRRLRADF